MAPEEAVRAYVAIGSNIEPETNIERALERLAGRIGLTDLSTFYWSPALDRHGQPDFLNGACLVQTRLAAPELKFGVLRVIEKELGRRRSRDRFAARPIDLDIALYGCAVIRGPALTVPDPEIYRRAFLAVPLLELSRDAVLPDTGEPLHQVVARLDRSGLRPAEEFTQRMKARFGLWTSNASSRSSVNC